MREQRAGSTIDLTASRPSLLRAWWPAAVWIGLIAFESTDIFSADHTSSMLYSVLDPFVRPHRSLPVRRLPSLSAQDRARHRIRHVEPAAVARMAGDPRCKPVPYCARTPCSRGWEPFVAALDEWHQSYIPSRTGTWRDATLDTAAGVAFLVIAYFRLRRSYPD